MEEKNPLGQELDITEYQADSAPHDYVENLKSLPENDKNRMIQAGIDTEEAKTSGTFIQKDTSVIHALSLQEGLEIIPIKDNKLQLGTWQGVLFAEFDGPRNRTVILELLS